MSIRGNPIDGATWRATHRASVVAILGASAPKVESHGSKFYNLDRWVVRKLVDLMCQWAKAHPQVTPTLATVRQWVIAANHWQVPPERRRIVIASTPSVLPPQIGLALAGGGYHEALHSKYSRRMNLNLQTVVEVVLPRWNLVQDWAPYTRLLLRWTNLIEDIRIERCGCEVYPGISSGLCALQDFILAQEEAQDRKRAQRRRENTASRAAYVLEATFRDLGLSYETEAQTTALKKYRKLNPEAFDLVESGPFRPLLDQTIALQPEDDLACLSLAMDVIVLLEHLSTLSSPPSASIRTGDPVDEEDDSGDDGDDGDEGSGEDSGEGSGGDSGDEEDSGDSGEGSGGDSGNEGDEGPPSRSIPGGGASRPTRGTDKGDGPSLGGGAGGHHWDPERALAWALLAEDIKGTPESEVGLLDLSSALSAGVSAENAAEDAACRADERPWRPFNPSLDVVQTVQHSASIPHTHLDGSATQIGGSLAEDKIRAQALYASVSAACGYLRARFRRLFQGVAQQETLHGLRRGSDLSEMMLVDTFVDLRGGRDPDRAYCVTTEEVDTSVAAVIVLDESGSMQGSRHERGKLQDAAMAVMALTEPLDSNGAAVLVVGVRDGPENDAPYDEDMREGGYHRIDGVCIDVFKQFDERFHNVMWRFANTRGVGGTPLSDGVQFGLDALAGRSETHRLLFVITDGEPNPNHTPVLRRQMRLAQEAGVVIVGVGVGAGCKRVLTLFDHSVWSPSMAALPQPLVEKLTSLLDFRGSGWRRTM